MYTEMISCKTIYKNATRCPFNARYKTADRRTRISSCKKILSLLTNVCVWGEITWLRPVVTLYLTLHTIQSQQFNTSIFIILIFTICTSRPSISLWSINLTTNSLNLTLQEPLPPISSCWLSINFRKLSTRCWQAEFTKLTIQLKHYTPHKKSLSH